mmetsp:Transcript_2611/g.7159  ORF Transcript_2611/g.7159 Transcript_2611/m.7159 type:complete len:470 (+) Transcript_2611:140-1549(+)
MILQIFRMQFRKRLVNGRAMKKWTFLYACNLLHPMITVQLHPLYPLPARTTSASSQHEQSLLHDRTGAFAVRLLELLHINPRPHALGDWIPLMRFVLHHHLHTLQERFEVGLRILHAVHLSGTEQQEHEIPQFVQREFALVQQIEQSMMQAHLSHAMKRQCVIQPLVVLVDFLGLAAEIVQHLQAELELRVEVVVVFHRVFLVGAQPYNDPHRQPLQRLEGRFEFLLRALGAAAAIVGWQAVGGKHDRHLAARAVQLRQHLLDSLAYGSHVRCQRRHAGWLRPLHGLSRNLEVIVERCRSALADTEFLRTDAAARIVQQPERCGDLQQPRHLGVVVDGLPNFHPPRARHHPDVAVLGGDYSVSVTSRHAAGIVHDPNAQREGGRVALQLIDETVREALLLEGADLAGCQAVLVLEQNRWAACCRSAHWCRWWWHDVDDGCKWNIRVCHGCCCCFFWCIHTTDSGWFVLV